MKVKKNLSLEDKVVEKAEKKAKQMGFSFSSYVTHLINNDLTGTIETTQKIKKEKNTKVSNAIDDILG